MVAKNEILLLCMHEDLSISIVYMLTIFHTSQTPGFFHSVTCSSNKCKKKWHRRLCYSPVDYTTRMPFLQHTLFTVWKSKVMAMSHWIKWPTKHQPGSSTDVNYCNFPGQIRFPNFSRLFVALWLTTNKIHYVSQTPQYPDFPDPWKSCKSHNVCNITWWLLVGELPQCERFMVVWMKLWSSMTSLFCMSSFFNAALSLASSFFIDKSRAQRFVKSLQKQHNHKQHKTSMSNDGKCPHRYDQFSHPF